MPSLPGFVLFRLIVFYKNAIPSGLKNSSDSNELIIENVTSIYLIKNLSLSALMKYVELPHLRLTSIMKILDMS